MIQANIAHFLGKLSYSSVASWWSTSKLQTGLQSRPPSYESDGLNQLEQAVRSETAENRHSPPPIQNATDPRNNAAVALASGAIAAGFGVVYLHTSASREMLAETCDEMAIVPAELIRVICG